MATWPAFACASGQSECKLGTREGLVMPPHASPGMTPGVWLRPALVSGEEAAGTEGNCHYPQCPISQACAPYPRDEEAIWALHFLHLPHRERGRMPRESGGEQSMAQHPQQGEQPCPAEAAQGAPQKSERNVPGAGNSRVACLMHFMSPQYRHLEFLWLWEPRGISSCCSSAADKPPSSTEQQGTGHTS